MNSARQRGGLSLTSVYLRIAHDETGDPRFAGARKWVAPDHFWLRELRVSQHFSTFYGSSVQSMDTPLNAQQHFLS